jgi:hypothetical protein
LVSTPQNGIGNRFNSNPTGGVKPGTMSDWTPLSNEERQYYDSLFQSADTKNSGSLAGQAAVAFFTKSGLDINVLKQVWEIADSAKQNFLTRSEFYCAMRLIAMAQNSPGIPLSKEALLVEGSNPLPLPRFLGIPLPSAGLMVSQGQGQHSFPHPEDPYYMSQEDLSKYEILFPTYDPDGDGYITGQEAVPLFNKSGLDRHVLKQIWEIADVDRDARLNRVEFVTAMHLIVCVSKKGLPVPLTMPTSLKRPTQDFSPSTPSKQMTPSNKSMISDVFINLDGEPSMVPPASGPIRTKPQVQMLTDLDDNRFINAHSSSPANFSTSNQSQYQHRDHLPLNSSRSGSISTPVTEGNGKFFIYGDKSGDVCDLGEAADGLIEVSNAAIMGLNNASTNQKAGSEGVMRIIQRLLEEKTALKAELDAFHETGAAEKKTLDDLFNQAETLQLEIQRMRAQRHEQEIAQLEMKDTINTTRISVENLQHELAAERAHSRQPEYNQLSLSGGNSTFQTFKEFENNPFKPPQITYPTSTLSRKLSNDSHSFISSPSKGNISPLSKPSTSEAFSTSGQLDPFVYPGKMPQSSFEPFSTMGSGGDVFSKMSDPFGEADPFSGVSGGVGGTFDAFPTPSSEPTRFDAFGGR